MKKYIYAIFKVLTQIFIIYSALINLIIMSPPSLECNSKRTGIFVLFTDILSQFLEKCLVYNSHSKNICWINVSAVLLCVGA